MGPLHLLYRCFQSHLPDLDVGELCEEALLHQVHHLVLPDPLLPQSQTFVSHPGGLAGLTVGLLQLGLDLNVSGAQWSSVEANERFVGVFGGQLEVYGGLSMTLEVCGGQ